MCFTFLGEARWRLSAVPQELWPQERSQGRGNLQRVTDRIMPTSNFPSSSQEVCWSVVNSGLTWGAVGWDRAL